MDTILKNGDFEAGENGFPVLADGAEERFQRAVIRLTVPRGAFVYNPKLGSGLKGLLPGEPGFEENALFAAQEALLPLPQVRVKSVRLVSAQPPVLGVTLEWEGRQMETEVALS